MVTFNNLSCRYDSFSFLFFTKLYELIINNNNLKLGNNLSDFINLVNKIIINIEENNKKISWDIVNENKNYDLDILDNNNGYMNEYHFHHIFNWFLDESLFTIKYNTIKTCSLCFNFENKIDISLPYITITLADIINYNNLEDIIYSKFAIVKSACSNCSYYGIGKNQDIKKEDKYKTCLTQQYSKIIFPNYIFFTFELSKENEQDNSQFSNLKKYRKKIIDLIQNEFTFTNFKMSLLGIICMPSINHYSAYCHNCFTEKLNYEKNNSYYYDDTYNGGEVQIIENPNFKSKIEFISKYNPFIILYGKIN